MNILLLCSISLLFPIQGYGSSSKSDRIFVVPHRFAYWPSTDIPFEIDPSLKENDEFRSLLSEAMKEIEIRTCITFIPVESLGKRHKSKTANLKPIVFNSSKTECSTYLTSSAREETRYPILLELVEHAKIFLNENCSQDYSFVAGNLVQALGFIPEHARSDRDQYIKILKPKILDSDSNDPLRNIVLSSGLHSNVTYSGENFYTPYDIYSITHMPSYPMNDTRLGPMVLHKNRGDQATCLESRVLSYDAIPSAKRLSAFDVTKINLRYECGFKSRYCNDSDEKMCLEEGIGYVSDNTFLGLEALNKCGNDKFAWDQCPRTCGRCHPDRMPTLNIEEPPLCGTFPINYLPKRNVSDQNDVLYQALACVCSDKDYAETLSDERIKYFCDVYACKTYMKYLC